MRVTHRGKTFSVLEFEIRSLRRRKAIISCATHAKAASCVLACQISVLRQNNSFFLQPLREQI